MSALEGVDFEGLLVWNYDELKDKECEEQVVKFVESNESVSDKDLGFIKMITKVASHIVKSDSGSLDEYLGRLHDYSMEGFEKSSELREILDSREFFVTGAHLLSYAGAFAYEEFEKTGDIRWGVKAYDLRLDSADMIKRLNIEDAGYRYGFASQTAQKLAERTRDCLWFKRMFECSRISADFLKNSDPTHATHLYGYAALAAKKLFKSTGRTFWLELWYTHSRKSADMASEQKLAVVGKKYASAAEAARLLSDRVGGEKLRWLNRALECYEVALDSGPFPEPVYYQRLKYFSGDTAKQVYWKTIDVNMARKAMDFYKSFLDSPAEERPKEFRDLAIRAREDMKFLREAVESERARGFEPSVYRQRPTQAGIF